eukprot:scaffold31794_cov68-Phaeocystis_antarctica.AAC.1
MQDVLRETATALQDQPLAAGLWRGCVAVLDRSNPNPNPNPPPPPPPPPPPQPQPQPQPILA